MCDNEMSRDHDAPLEYLRILASLKLRFGLATLVTAHGALPVVYPIEEQGHSATQCLRGILTFPTVALVVKLPNERYGPSGRSPYPVGIHLRPTNCWSNTSEQ